MKKIISFLLATLLCGTAAVSLIGCDTDRGGDGGTDTDTKEQYVKIEQFDYNNAEHINWYGRTYIEENATVTMYPDGQEDTRAYENVHWFNFSASGFEVTFKGTELKATFIANNSGWYDGETLNINEWRPVLKVFVDGKDDPSQAVETIDLDSDYEKEYTLVSGLSDDYHTVKVLKTSEVINGSNALTGLTTDGEFYEPPAKPVRKIEVYGDSITCGVGIMDGEDIDSNGTSFTEDGTATYAGIVARHFNAQYNVVARAGRALLRADAGNGHRDASDVFPNEENLTEGTDEYKAAYAAWVRDEQKDMTVYDDWQAADFYTTSAEEKVGWDFSSYQPDVVLINLGTNDFGFLNVAYYMDDRVVDAEEQVLVDQFIADFKARYETFVDELHGKYPNAKIVALWGMMVEGYMYEDFEGFIQSLVEDSETPRTYLSALKLASMNDYADDIRLNHPGKQAHEVSAAILAEHLSEILGW